MSYFKKFTDLIGGIACFFASVFFIGKYMSFTVPEAESLKEAELTMSKLELFLSAEHGKDYRAYVVLIICFVLSVAFGRWFKRLPAVTVCLNLLPLWQVMNMVFQSSIYEYEGLFVMLAALHVAGGIYDAVWQDRQDNKKRTFWAAGAVGLVTCSVCAAAIKISEFSTVFYDRFMAGELQEVDMELKGKLGVIGIDIMTKIPEDEKKVLTILLVLVVVSVVVSIILRGVYFVDIVLAGIPFVYGIYLWQVEKIVSAPMAVLVTLFVYFFLRVALLVTGVGIKTRQSTKNTQGTAA